MTPEYLRSILDYDPVTGCFTWLRRANATNWWNVQYAGKKAGWLTKEAVLISVNDKSYRAHRLAYLIMTGEWPPVLIDHINGNPTDNRWVNLRVATQQQNLQNRGAQKNNTSGFKGVSKYRNGRWTAQIHQMGRKIHLGYFSTPDEAHLAYSQAAQKYHGEFAKSG